MADKFAYGKAVTRDMSHLKKHPRFTELIEKGQGNLTDLSGNHTIKLEWKLNDWADRDKVFKLMIDDQEVFIDLEELTYYTRVMFS